MVQIDMNSKEIKDNAKPEQDKPPVKIKKSFLKKKGKDEKPTDSKDKKVKKPKIKKPINKKKVIKWVIIIIAVLGLGAAGVYAWKIYSAASGTGLVIQPGDIFKPVEPDPELLKDASGKYTNILAVGIDTRATNSSLKNTDTVMVISYNHETNDVVMISIPRDFFVLVPDQGWYTKINGIYASGENIEEGYGLTLLEQVVTDVTGLEIQYHAMVDLQGFRDVVDAVGGITVDVKNTFSDYQYPTGNTYAPLYEVISFDEGLQTMDGDTALKYARSRKSPNPLEGSDFARARRQQNVIVALKDKVLSTETLLNPTKPLEMLDAIEGNVQISEYSLEDIRAGIILALKFEKEDGQIYSFVLDPNIAGKQLLTDRGLTTDGAYVIGPRLGLDDYTDLHAYLDLAMQSPEFYSVDPKVYVYNTGLGNQAAYDKTLEIYEDYPFMNITYIGNLYYDKEGSFVYDHTEDENKVVVDMLAQYLGEIEATQPEYITTNLNGEGITILLGAEPVVEDTSEVVTE